MPPLSLKELTRKSKELKCDSKGHVQFNFYDLQKPRLKKPATFFQQGLTIQENEWRKLTADIMEDWGLIHLLWLKHSHGQGTGKKKGRDMLSRAKYNVFKSLTFNSSSHQFLVKWMKMRFRAGWVFLWRGAVREEGHRRWPSPWQSQVSRKSESEQSCVWASWSLWGSWVTASQQERGSWEDM